MLPRRGNTLELRHELTDPTESWRPDEQCQLDIRGASSASDDVDGSSSPPAGWCAGKSEGERDEADHDDWIGYREVSGARRRRGGASGSAAEIVPKQGLEFFAKLPRCLVGIEACASSHYWARELIALGHEVKLMPAQYVKPYVKCGKNDAADAEAIGEAVTRPTSP